MKTTITRNIVRLTIVLIFSTCLSINPQYVHGQDSVTVTPSEKYTIEELTQMLAPIALYPDALLSQILMASTYPIEVIEADRWIRLNSRLTGNALDTALLNKDWDPSVKAISHFPSTLAVMSEQITKTTNLGNAFLVQEAEVLDVIQHLRDQAYSQGNLHSTSEQNVIIKKEIIIIEPVRPKIIYIPNYDPYYVYGTWWYPNYRPYYWGPSRGHLGISISFWPGTSFNFAFGGWSYFDWNRRYIHIDSYKRPRFVRANWYRSSGRWQHAPRHRRGVAYRDKYTARKYGQTRHRSTDLRHESRGYINERQRVQRSDRTDRKRSRVNPTPKTVDRQRQQAVRDSQQQSNVQIQQQQRRVRDLQQQHQQRIRDLQQRQPVRESQQQQRVRESRQQQPNRDLQQQQRVRETRQQQPNRDLQQQQRVRESRQQQPNRDLQQQQRVRESRQQQPNRDLQQQQRVRELRQQQPNRDLQQQPRVRESRQQQQTTIRIDSTRTHRKAAKQQRGDSAFNQIRDGNVERRSSKRGHSSRQEIIKRQQEQ